MELRRKGASRLAWRSASAALLLACLSLLCRQALCIRPAWTAIVMRADAALRHALDGGITNFPQLVRTAVGVLCQGEGLKSSELLEILSSSSKFLGCQLE